MTKIPTEQEKFDSLMRKVKAQGDCLICHVRPNAKGYAYISFGRGRKARAHRFVFEFLHGKLPDNMIVMHTCDIRNCINPEHLKAGTITDNQADMKQKGRARNKPRACNREANQQAVDMHNLGYSFAEIARKQNVGKSTAAYRVNRGLELGQ